MKREEKKARGSGKFPELRGGRKTRADGLNNIKRASVPQVLSICTSIAFGSAFPTFLFTTKKIIFVVQYSRLAAKKSYLWHRPECIRLRYMG